MGAIHGYVLTREQHFEHPPLARDWTIFQQHADLVHHISESINDPAQYSESVFLDVAVGVLLGHSFPNLCSLRLPATMTRIIPLLVHKGLASLTVSTSTLTDPKELDRCRWLMASLPTWCPNLTHLEVSVFENGAYIDIGLAAVLKDFRKLTEVHLTPQLLTEEAICVLARLPQLEHLNSTWADTSVGAQQTHLMVVPPEAHCEFKTIKTLKLSHSFEEVASFLKASHTRELRSLSIDPDGWQEEKYHLVIEAAITCCPKLETLSIDLRKLEIQFPPPEPATWLLFQALPRLRNLTSLTFTDLRMDADALTKITRALPFLQKLMIASTSTGVGPPTFPMSILPTIGSFCPQLKYLCLFMDTSPSSLGPTDRSTEDIIPFKCLDKLNVGTSSLDSPAPEVALYLSSLLREDCCLSRICDYPPDEKAMAKYNSWQPVIDFLPVIIRIRKEVVVAAASISLD